MSSPRDDDRQTWRIPSTDPLWDHEAVDWEETDFTRWLEGQEAARRPPAGEAVATRWVLEFDCKQSSSGGRRSRPLFHCEEAWSMCVQMCEWRDVLPSPWTLLLLTACIADRERRAARGAPLLQGSSQAAAPGRRDPGRAER